MVDITDWKESLDRPSDDLSPIREHARDAHSEATRPSTPLSLSPAALLAPRNQAEAREISTMSPELHKPGKPIKGCPVNRRWKVIVNEEIEVGL